MRRFIIHGTRDSKISGGGGGGGFVRSHVRDILSSRLILRHLCLVLVVLDSLRVAVNVFEVVVGVCWNF